MHLASKGGLFLSQKNKDDLYSKRSSKFQSSPVNSINLKRRLVKIGNTLKIPVKTYAKLYAVYSQLINLVKYKDPYFFRIVCIEINTYCNRKCYYCPVSLEKKVPSHFMPEDLFRLTIKRLKDIKFSGTIMYHFYNEPLLDKRLPEFVKYTNDQLPGCLIRILTNGDYLTMELADDLIQAGVCDFAVTDHNRKPGRLAAKLRPVVEKYPDQIHIESIHDKPLSNRGGAIDVEVPDKRHNGTCTIIYEELKIDYQGNVLLCSNDYYRSHKFGNIQSETLKEIWNKKDYNRIRSKLRKGIPELEICKKCNFIA